MIRKIKKLIKTLIFEKLGIQINLYISHSQNKKTIPPLKCLQCNFKTHFHMIWKKKKKQ